MFTLIGQSAKTKYPGAEQRMSLASKITDERRKRLAAERLLELKQAELFAANRKLGLHAQQLSEEIVETRAVVETIRGENQRVKSDLNVANEKIAIAERRLWHSIETIDDGFAFFNAENELIMANRAYMGIFDGLDIIEPGVNYVTILQVLTDEGIVDTGDLNPAEWRRVMTERFQHKSPESANIKLWDGATIKLVDQRGPEGDLVSLALNITASVVYEKQLESARRVAEGANRAKSAFLANMSHEIRTPMNGVIGMADLLAESELDAEQQLYVETIKNSGEALLVIINDVLDYSKIEARKLELHPEPFDLERAIQEVLMLLQPSAREKKISLLLDYDMFLPTHVVGDPGRLRQVLTNLVGNAVKFTTQGHVLVRMTGVPNFDDKILTLHIGVEDTGIGIPAEMVDHIFGEFNQVEAETNRKFEGTGLGLAISKQLIEIMKGEIWVRSEEGVGSCFGLRVDLGMTEESVSEHWEPPTGLSHVLVVDQFAANRGVLERQFSQLGVRVTACATIDEGLQALDDGLDLVVADEKALTDMLADIDAQLPDMPVILLQKPSDMKGSPLADWADGVLPNTPSRQEVFAMLKTLPFETTAQPSAPEPLRQMRILVAEDNKTNQLVLRKMLKNLGVSLTFANNGEEAVSAYQKIAPDLIFMDISMPKMDGKEATIAIRALEAEVEKHTQIVALTAHAMEGDGRNIMSAGLDYYLTKPLSKAKLLEQIEGVFTDEMLPLQALQEAG